MIIKKNQSLLKLNSFRIDVCAKEYVEITNESELLELYGKPVSYTHLTLPTILLV